MKTKKPIKILIILGLASLMLIIIILSVMRYIDLNNTYPSMTEVRISQSIAADVGGKFTVMLNNIEIFQSEEDLLVYFDISAEDFNQVRPDYLVKYVLIDMEIINLSGTNDIYEEEFILRLGEQTYISNTYVQQFLFKESQNVSSAGIGEATAISQVYAMSYREDEENMWNSVVTGDFEIIYRYYPYFYIWEWK